MMIMTMPTPRGPALLCMDVCFVLFKIHSVQNSFDSDRLRRGDDVAIVRNTLDADGAGGALCIVCPEAESALAIGIHHKVGIPVERDALVGAIGCGGALIDAVVERARMLVSERRDFLHE